MRGLLLASRLVDPLAQPRRAPTAAACTWSIDQGSSRTPKSMIGGPGPVWPIPTIRIAAHPGIGPCWASSAMGLDPPPAPSQWRVQPSHSALALDLRCGQDCRARPGSRQRSRSRGADQTSARTGDAPPPFSGAGRPSSTSAGRPLKRDEQTLYAAGTNAPLHIGGRDCLQLPAATTRIFVENLR
jgi:hypothetical protein